MLGSAPPITTSRHSFPALDGLRGLAALIVVFHHYTLAFFPANITLDPGVVYTWIDPYIRFSPLSLLIDGHFAVSIFFVLSGFVLSQKFFSTRHFNAWEAVFKRYFRLTIPVLASMLLAWLLLVFGLYANHSVSQLSNSDWFKNFYMFKPDLWTAVWQGLIGVYTTPAASYNTITWTIGIELVGSLIVFASLSLFGVASRRHWLFYIFLIAITWNSWYFGFVLGLLLAEVWHTTIGERLTQLLSTGLWIPITMMATFMGYGTFASELPSMFKIHGMNADANMILIHGLGAAAIVLVCLSVRPVQRFFNMRVLQWLGKISFSLYLLHLIILSSLASQLFLALSHRFSYTNDFRITLVISVGLTMLLSQVFYVYIDKSATAHARDFYQLIIGQGSRTMQLGDAVNMPGIYIRKLSEKIPTRMALLMGRSAESAVVEETLDR